VSVIAASLANYLVAIFWGVVVLTVGAGLLVAIVWIRDWWQWRHTRHGDVVKFPQHRRKK